MADDYKKVQEEYEKMMEAMFSGKSSEEVAASILQQQEAMMQHMDMDQVMKEAMGAAAALVSCQKRSVMEESSTSTSGIHSVNTYIGSMASVMPGWSLIPLRLMAKLGTSGSSCRWLPMPCPTRSRTTP